VKKVVDDESKEYRRGKNNIAQTNRKKVILMSKEAEEWKTQYHEGGSQQTEECLRDLTRPPEN